jgi:hypothetical protein
MFARARRITSAKGRLSPSNIPSIFNSLHLASLPSIPDPEESTGHTIFVSSTVPISDFTTIRDSVSKDSAQPSDVPLVDQLPPLPQRRTRAFPSIFKRKIELCKVQCCFSGDVDAIAIRAKTIALGELLALVSNQAVCSSTLTTEDLDLLIEVINVNLLRKLPPSELQLWDQSLVAQDPAWCQLSYVYKILESLVQVFPAAPAFQKLTVQLLGVASSANPSERNALSNWYIGLIRALPDMRFRLADILEGKLKSLIGSPSPEPYALSTILPVVHFILTRTFPLIPHATGFFCIHSSAAGG